MGWGHRLHNLQATIRLVITGIDHNQRASPTQSFRIGTRLIHRYAKVCELVN
jgi:hypothetical protein